MRRIVYLCLSLGLLLSAAATSAATQISIGIGMPQVHIGVNVSSYPHLAVVPGYPVYYAPRLHANLFFYDGLYWIYDNDDWYASAWYNGPWDYVSAVAVPLYILRVPVRYYRLPPVYFHGWRQDAPPQWGRHWGHDWEQQRHGWDRWDRRANPQPAPPPAYQQQYSGERYPRQLEQQQELKQKNYRYQPRDPEVRQHYKSRAEGNASGNDRDMQAMPKQRGSGDVGVDPGSARANGGRQWDMPRDSQPTAAPQSEGSGARGGEPMPRGGEARQRPDDWSAPQRASGRAERQPQATEPRQQPRAEERQPRQQGRDGGGESRREQDSARGRGRNE
jgi:hypothetical protein